MDKEAAGPGTDERGRELNSTDLDCEDDFLHLPLFKRFIDNDMCAQLQRHFMRSGKGRPPDLPSVTTLTNGLLLLLFVLKLECNAPFKQLKTWLTKLLPHTEPVSESRITSRIRVVVQTITKMAPSQVTDFLNEEYDFHQLPPALSVLGVNRLHLTGERDFCEMPQSSISNEVVVALDHFRVRLKELPSFVYKWILKLCAVCSQLSDYKLKKKVKDTLALYKKLSKSKKDQDKLNIFLNTAFVEASGATEREEPPPCCDCVVKQAKLDESEKQLQEKKKIIRDLNYSVDSNLEKDRQISDLVLKNNELSHSLQRETNTASDERANVKDLKKKVKLLKQENVQMKDTLDLATKSKLYQKNAALKRKIDQLESDNSSLASEKEKLDSSVSTLKKSLKSAQTLKSNYKVELNKEKTVTAGLKEILKMDSDQEDSPLQIREGSSHKYNNKIRKTYYSLFGEANVAISNCSKVVSTVAKNLFDVDLKVDDLPTKTTAINFSNEANVIAQHQVFEEISGVPHFTFACDGTSRQKSHYIEQHVILSNGKKLSLGFSMVASETSDTLLEKCIDSFKNICSVHCLNDNSVDEDDLLKEILRKMKGMMSDRAAVMKSFDKKVVEFKKEILKGEDCSTHFLYCNAHFLLKLSSAIEQAVLGEEGLLPGGKLGRDSVPIYGSFEKKESAVVRVIRMTSECLGPRGDEKHGGRSEWLSFCDLQDIRSKFSTYRSNRFNNLFQNATALLFHRDHVKSFLTVYASHSNLKLQSVLHDINDARILSVLSVISFFHIYFTEPYWQLMNSKKSYLDFPQYVDKMRTKLSLWGSDDYDITKAQSVFDDFVSRVDDIQVIETFFASDDFLIDVFKPVFVKLVSQFVCALQQQLSDFLEGGIFSGVIPDDIKKVLETCPLTNLTGERLFGDLDFDMNKRRNASLHVRSTTNMWKHNETSKWLDGLDKKHADNLIETAMKHGPEWRQRHRDEIARVKRAIKEKIQNNKSLKEEKDIKSKERKLAAIDALLENGIPLVQTKEQLDEIFDRPGATELLKDQIRYRSLVRGEKITLVGNKLMLYQKLLDHIQQ